MKDLNNILNGFEPINLKEMDNVKLMDRTDTKFILKKTQLFQILPTLFSQYRVLDVNDKRISRYESLYFDTPQFDLFRKHQCGKQNRYKVRFRKYVESDLNFFEVKFKNNKGRTIKKRVKENKIDGVIHKGANNLLTSNSPFNADTLEAKLWVNYSRITLVNKHSPERVTLDINLHFKHGEQVKNIENLVIAEVKQDKTKGSHFIKLMKSLRIREGSISKYCFGVINLYQQIRHNNFKENLTRINKTLYGTIGRA